MRGVSLLFRYSKNPYSNRLCAILVRYCFGAPYVCNELSKETVTAGAFAHPAFLKEEHFNKITSECTYPCTPKQRTWDSRLNIEPLFLSCSEEDHTFDKNSRGTALKILQSGHKTYHLQLFSGVEHGFALRGDMKDPYQRK